MASSHGQGNSAWSYLRPWMKGCLLGTVSVLLILCLHLLLLGISESIVVTFIISIIVLPIVGALIGMRYFKPRIM